MLSFELHYVRVRRVRGPLTMYKHLTVVHFRGLFLLRLNKSLLSSSSTTMDLSTLLRAPYACVKRIGAL